MVQTRRVRGQGNRVGLPDKDKDKSQDPVLTLFIGFESQWRMNQFEATTQSSASTQQHNNEQTALCLAWLDLLADWPLCLPT